MNTHHKNAGFLWMRNSAVVALWCAVVCCAGCAKKGAPPENAVIVWTYDSFTSEWGPGAAIAQNFERETGLSIRWESAGDAGSLLARLLLEGGAANADVALGLDQNFAPRALESGLFEAYTPKNAQNILPDIPFSGDFRLIPYDYSYFSFIYDSEKVSTPPKSLDELTQPAWKEKIILMDPRTSSPGLGFLAWTRAVYGEKWTDYWRGLLPSTLTIAAGWDEGYGLFTKGEAPLVFSYTTSPAYHAENENSRRYKAALFEEGHPIQVEFAGLLAAAPDKEAARRFLDFMLSDGFQNEIPLGNWMYPVTSAALPPSFAAAPKPARALNTTPVSEADLNLWADIARGAR